MMDLRLWAAPLLMAPSLLLGCAEEPREHELPPVASSEGTATLGDWVPGADEHAGHGHAPGAHPAPGMPADPHAGIPGAPPIRPADPHAGVPGAPPAAPAPSAAPAGGARVRGTVAETIAAAGYTYLRVDTTDGEIWVAALNPNVEEGTTIEAAGMVMQNFRSSALDRTFEQLVLANVVQAVESP